MFDVPPYLPYVVSMIARLPSAQNATPTIRRGDERLIRVTGPAALKVSTLLQKQGRPTGVLRVAVIGG